MTELDVCWSAILKSVGFFVPRLLRSTRKWQWTVEMRKVVGAGLHRSQKVFKDSFFVLKLRVLSKFSAALQPCSLGAFKFI
jgi:hypothetical protein